MNIKIGLIRKNIYIYKFSIENFLFLPNYQILKIQNTIF